MSMAKRGLYIVMATIAPDKEEAFNKWYNEEHVPRVLERHPGVLTGKRYKIVSGDDKHQYMAIYEYESLEALEKAQSSESTAQLIREYDAAFGKGGRHHISAVEVKSLVVG
jgi:antibiotic biosynthesis monooxygenase (ABM) superfamily enzyme